MLNGNVSTTIPLLHLPGRAGFDLSINLLVNSKTYSLIGAGAVDTGTPTSGSSLSPQYPMWLQHPFVYNQSNNAYGGYPVMFAGGTLSLPTLAYKEEDFKMYVPGDSQTNTDNYEEFVTSCYDNFVYIDSGGVQHGLNIVADCQGYSPSSENILVDYSLDGSYIRADATNPLDVIITEKNGVQSHFALQQMNGYSSSTGVAKAQSIPFSINDTNGNAVTLLQTDENIAITDSTGRTVNVSPNAITYKDSNGQSQTISVTSSTVDTGSKQSITSQGAAKKPAGSFLIKHLLT
jgi:hypothetical protein